MLIKLFVCIIQKAALKYSNENYTLVLSCSIVGLHLHIYSRLQPDGTAVSLVTTAQKEVSGYQAHIYTLYSNSLSESCMFTGPASGQLGPTDGQLRARKKVADR